MSASDGAPAPHRSGVDGGRYAAPSASRLIEALLIASEEAMLATDPAGIVLAASSQALELLHCPPGSLDGASIYDLMAPADREPAQVALMHVAADGEVEHRRLLLHCVDGAPLPAFATIRRLVTAEGGLLGFRWRLSRLAEQDLEGAILQEALLDARRHETQLGDLARTARSLLGQPDFEGAARAILGPCRAATGATAGFVALLTVDGQQTEMAYIEDGGYPCAVDRSLPMPTRGLRAIACESRSSVRHNDFANSAWAEAMPERHQRLDNVLIAPMVMGDRTVGMVALANKPGGFSDDDERLAQAFAELAAIALTHIRSVQAVEDSEERFRSVTDTAKDAIIAVDGDDLVVLWNQAAEAMFGYAVAEAVGVPIDTFLPLLSRFSPALSAGDGLADTPATGSVATTGRRRSGESFPAELTASGWRTRSGRFTTMIVRDAGERRRAQEALVRYAHEQTALHAVSSVVLQSRDPEAVLAAVLPAFAADAGWITLYPRAGQQPVAYSVGVPAALAEAIVAQTASCATGAPEGEGRVAPTGPLLTSACPYVAPAVLAASGLLSHVSVALRVGERDTGALHLAWREVRRFDRVDEGLAHALGQQVALAIYNTQLYEASLQVDRLRLLAELDGALAAVLEPDAVEAISLRQLAMALRASVGALFVLPEPGSGRPERVVTLGSGWAEAGADACGNDFSCCVPALGQGGREPVRLTRGQFVAMCPGWSDAALSDWGEEGLLVPVPGERRTVALMLFAGLADGRSVSAEDIVMSQAAAGRVGQAIENALLFEAVRSQRQQVLALSARLAQSEEAERQRLARELHDEVGQNLTALGLNLNIASMALPHDGATDPVRLRIDDSLALVSQTTEAIRNVMADLRPPGLDEYGLLSALRWYGSRFRARTGLAFSLEGGEPDPRLPSSLETALFRIAQEALTNVAKHAAAMHAVVSVMAEPGLVRLTVADDGAGFDVATLPAHEQPHGWGLLTMRERSQAEGGSCRVESSLGQGTRVIVEVPR
ncbi:MAG: GAF domain-containing protein [Anaerolineae bacterium]